MSPAALHPDQTAYARDMQCHDLLTSLMTISGNTQLLQRQILRSPGLTVLERTAMLDRLAVTMTAVACLKDGLPRL